MASIAAALLFVPGVFGLAVLGLELDGGQVFQSQTTPTSTSSQAVSAHAAC